MHQPHHTGATCITKHWKPVKNDCTAAGEGAKAMQCRLNSLSRGRNSFGKNKIGRNVHLLSPSGKLPGPGLGACTLPRLLECIELRGNIFGLDRRRWNSLPAPVWCSIEIKRRQHEQELRYTLCTVTRAHRRWCTVDMKKLRTIGVDHRKLASRKKFPVKFF